MADAAAAPQRLRQTDAGGGAVALEAGHVAIGLCVVTADRHVEPGPQTGPGLDDRFVQRPLVGALGQQRRVGLVGQGDRLPQRLRPGRCGDTGGDGDDGDRGERARTFQHDCSCLARTGMRTPLVSHWPDAGPFRPAPVMIFSRVPRNRRPGNKPTGRRPAPAPARQARAGPHRTARAATGPTLPSRTGPPCRRAPTVRPRLGARRP